MYTDGFVKKRQLNMNVAHFVSPIAEGSGEDSLSSDLEADAPRSALSNGESEVSDNTNIGEVMLHAYMINPSSDNGDGSDRDESSENNDSHDGNDVESYQYGPEKMMECTICKVMVRKAMSPYYHSYRDTSGDDSEGGHMRKIMMLIAFSIVRNASAMSR
jgi:hypothetical protein